MPDARMIADTIAILQRPDDHDIVRLANQVHETLSCIDMLLPSKHIEKVVALTRMLLPEVALDIVVPAALQALWIYIVDAVVDEGDRSQELQARLERWKVSDASAICCSEPGQRLLLTLSDTLQARMSCSAHAAWWGAVCQFIDAQVAQRSRSASSYLDYLATRTVAQGVPLTITLAAQLVGATEELQTARSAMVLWWAGCYVGLHNDLSSYAREVQEGVAATANARGVLRAITMPSGTMIDEQTTEALVQRDMDTAWTQLMHVLGPRRNWTTIDWIIARLAHLLCRGYAT